MNAVEDPAASCPILQSSCTSPQTPPPPRKHRPLCQWVYLKHNCKDQRNVILTPGASCHQRIIILVHAALRWPWRGWLAERAQFQLEGFTLQIEPILMVSREQGVSSQASLIRNWPLGLADVCPASENLATSQDTKEAVRAVYPVHPLLHCWLLSFPRVHRCRCTCQPQIHPTLIWGRRFSRHAISTSNSL